MDSLLPTAYAEVAKKSENKDELLKSGVAAHRTASRQRALYPNAAASVLLERFFYVLRDWKWPTPILLTPISDAGLGFEPWDPSFGGNRFHVMPILTPAYPSMNSTVSVSRQTLEVMQGEMAVALDRVHNVLASNGEGWSEVFATENWAGIMVLVSTSKAPVHCTSL